MLHRRIFLAALAATAAEGALAQHGKMTRIVVGFPAGGAVDAVARIFADELRVTSGGTFIVENRGGAGGRIGVQAVKDAAPDGATLLLTPSSILTIYPHIYKKLPYDPIKDLVAIAPACEYCFGLAVGPGAPVSTLAEFLERVKKDERTGSYGSPGSGTGPHFMGAMLAKASGAPLTHVPYKGGASAIQDTIGGQLPALITTIPNLLPHHKNGKIKILAQTSVQRTSALPDVPTFKELGFGDLSLREWFGFFGPAGLPPTTTTAIHGAITASKTQAAKAALARQGFDALLSDANTLTGLVKSDLAAWGSIVRSTGFKQEE